MVVEPGAFRTSFAGGSALSASEPMPEYEDSVGGFRKALPDSDGQQPGDPARAAAAILSALASDEPPLHLLLGNDAADIVIGQLDRDRAEFTAWESTSRGTDFAS
jgi:hypothetical protein